MKYKLFIFISIGFLICNDTLAIVGTKIITKRDFLRRSEYTLRPDYCRSNNTIAKKIILNSLIAEKILSLENQESNLDIESINLINGIKEQTMRRVMLEDKVTKNLTINNSDVLNLYENSLFEYEVNFITFGIESLNEIKSLIKKEKSLFDLALKIDIIPATKNLSFLNCDNLVVRDNIFSKKRFQGELVGPFNIKNTEYILIEIIKTKKILIIDEISQKNHFKEIEDIHIKSESKRIKKTHIHDIMTEKKLVFNKKTFLNLANSYFDKDELKSINPNDILFTLNDKKWKVEDLIELNKLNPILFRNSLNEKSDFYNQFKLAIVDMIQNYYLTEHSYKLNYENNFFVKNEYNIWKDYILATDKKEFILNNNKDLNIYLENLFDKYSEKIIIDFDIFENVNLSNIDMIVINKNQPYQLNVPPFPRLTTKNNLDYGSKKES